jgi:hypothetical protein
MEVYKVLEGTGRDNVKVSSAKVELPRGLEVDNKARRAIQVKLIQSHKHSYTQLPI